MGCDLIQEMTLEEYEKIQEEKHKSLEAEKAAERKVELDKEFEKMQLVENKKRDADFFIKLVREQGVVLICCTFCPWLALWR